MNLCNVHAGIHEVKKKQGSKGIRERFHTLIIFPMNLARYIVFYFSVVTSEHMRKVMLVSPVLDTLTKTWGWCGLFCDKKVRMTMK